MKQKQLLKRFQQNAFLQGWSRDDLLRLERSSTIVHCDANEVLSRDAWSRHEFLVLLDGTVTVTRATSQEARLVAGDHVGEVALLGGAHESSTVQAQTDGVALLVSEQDFISLLNTTPSFGRKLSESLALQVA